MFRKVFLCLQSSYRANFAILPGNGDRKILKSFSGVNYVHVLHITKWILQSHIWKLESDIYFSAMALIIFDRSTLLPTIVLRISLHTLKYI